MRRASLLLIVFLTACGGGNPPSTAPTPSPQAAPSAGPCTATLAPGTVVTDQVLDLGCTDAYGGLQNASYHVCKDGRRLFANDDLYGFVGQPIKRGDADDPEFKAAYDRCYQTN